MNVSPNTHVHNVLMNDILINFFPRPEKYATTTGIVDNFLHQFGLRRVERRLPQPSHQTIDLPNCTTRGIELALAGCFELFIESGNVPTNPF
jgi:hypothetical protein